MVVTLDIDVRTSTMTRGTFLHFDEQAYNPLGHSQRKRYSLFL